MENKRIEFNSAELTLKTIPEILSGEIELSRIAIQAVEASHAYVKEIVKTGQVVYGINTGFGKLSTQHIDAKDLASLQLNLIMSHAVGLGEHLPNDIIALTLLLKINSLVSGYSGVSIELIDRLCIFFNKRVYPSIPAKGSVGASGDLAPLAHLSCALLGIGTCWYKGRLQDASDVLKQLKLKPFVLGPKEGLGLINGTQVSTAIAVSALLKTRCLFETALVAGAMSLDAELGSDVPFEPLIHLIRNQEGQCTVGEIFIKLMEDSEIRRSHLVSCDKVQDPYSLRCQPQVMGAILDQLNYVGDILERECNAVTDNPLVFAKEKRVLSGGNFHAEYVAFAADNLAIAIAEIGSLSERRIELLLDASMSGLPPFLIQAPGLNSGLMMTQVTAAALVSENKTRCFPASVDSIPTSANQEDHVSMATHAAWRLHAMLDNLAGILAIELIAACQGIELRAPLKTSPRLMRYFKHLRQSVAFLDKDRWLAPDIEKIKTQVLAGEFDLNNKTQFNEITLWS